MPRISYKQLERLAQKHNIELVRDRDEDGPCVHVNKCFATDRDSFLAEVDRQWPGKYYREYTGSLTVWLRAM